MQILLACAKHMTTRSEVSPELSTKPRFLKEAKRHALQLAAFTEAELGKALKCNARLAILNKLRYLSFSIPKTAGPPYYPTMEWPTGICVPGNLQRLIMRMPTAICGSVPFYMACSGPWTASRTTVWKVV